MVIGVLYSMKVSTHVVTGCCECTREFFLTIFVSATEFCCCNMLQKIKSDNIILLWRQRFSQKFSGTHEVICPCDVSRQLVIPPVHVE